MFVHDVQTDKQQHIIIYSENTVLVAVFGLSVYLLTFGMRSVLK